LRALVEAHVPSDVRECSSKERFLAELDRLVRPLDRDADRVHVTASAIVAGVRGTVLHRHRRLGRWLQPGGHVDPGERVEETAVREVLEETGLGARHPGSGPALVRLDVHAAGTHVHLDLCFLLLAEDRDPSPALGESAAVRWFSFAEAEEIADPALRGALRAARAELERVAPS
jgi:8-oxo-dGTP pyrophosphatase MutT (NUDIX family)